ncbi:hypothetical protein [Actinoplanes sp. L3-i22]|uniref:hypothetical protein n=1 Tax=Actinoplanes sp. L3-i22 TaxID=2836373 RepID=UPI001C781393|nr:hypothetical protein [Actinoplanes sp. L3-i22]BCY07015.1 hypothetical protein L3i22_021030 [Actinoplanes sp. L3-i22]
MRAAVLAGVVPVVLLLSGPAQAAPKAATGVLGTYGFGRAAVIGAGGQSAGLWSVAGTHPGVAGDDLVITYTPRHRPHSAEHAVYTARFDQVSNPRTECERVGADGVAARVWVSFRCRTGIAPNYTLLVR